MSTKPPYSSMAEPSTTALWAFLFDGVWAWTHVHVHTYTQYELRPPPTLGPAHPRTHRQVSLPSTWQTEDVLPPRWSHFCLAETQ